MIPYFQTDIVRRSILQKEADMADILYGKPVADALIKRTEELVAVCRERGVDPTLAILRVGEKNDDLSYERSAMKRCALSGIATENVVLPVDVTEQEFFETLQRLNTDASVHGILMFRPLPKHLDSEKARKTLFAQKDVDGCGDLSLAGVFTNTTLGFVPCTAQAAMEILKYYDIPIAGKRAVVIGRSLVVGRPLAMLLMHENATVTICHTGTCDLKSVLQEADIIVTATGKMESFGKDHFKKGQTVIDVGIRWSDEKQKLCGDVCFDEVRDLVQAITPVPGGVGSVTTGILALHVAEAAYRSISY